MGEYSPPLASHSPITQKSSLASGLGGYKAHLTASTYSSHTVKSFLYDLKLLWSGSSEAARALAAYPRPI